MIVHDLKEVKEESGLYKITSPTGKVYIGQSTNLQKRLRAYYSLYGFLKSQPKIYKSLQKYGIENHTVEIIELCDILLLNERERYYKELVINERGWKSALFLRVDDKSEGPRHPDTMMKMQKARLGKKLSIETKQKIAAAHKGTKKPYISERNSIMFKNRPAPNRRAVLQYDKNGLLVGKYTSIQEAITKTGINPKACLSNVCKTAGGFIWIYE